MKEFSMEMNPVELRIAYAKYMTDDSKSNDEKEKAKKEYNRIMDLKIESAGNLV